MKKPMLLLLLLLAAGCNDTTRDETSAEAEPVVEAPRGLRATSFAPDLGVNLDDMTEADTGVFYHDVREGRGRVAEPGSSVTVEYRAWLPDGTLYEQRPSDDGFGLSSFVLGESEPVPGLVPGMTGMRVGGVRRIVVPPEQGYSLVGRPAGVPAGSALVFEVRLVGID